MARRRGRKGGRRYGRLRAFGHRARGVLSSPTRLMGFKKDGFHVSDAVIVGGAAMTALLPATTDSNSSAVGILMGKGGFASQPFGQRCQNALAAMTYVGLGYNMLGTTGSTYKGFGGMAVLSGVGMKVAAKFVNPFMRGSAVKL